MPPKAPRRKKATPPDSPAPVPASFPGSPPVEGVPPSAPARKPRAPKVVPPAPILPPGNEVGGSPGGPVGEAAGRSPAQGVARGRGRPRKGAAPPSQTASASLGLGAGQVPLASWGAHWRPFCVDLTAEPSRPQSPAFMDLTQGAAWEGQLAASPCPPTHMDLTVGTAWGGALLPAFHSQSVPLPLPTQLQPHLTLPNMHNSSVQVRGGMHEQPIPLPLAERVRLRRLCQALAPHAPHTTLQPQQSGNAVSEQALPTPAWQQVSLSPSSHPMADSGGHNQVPCMGQGMGAGMGAWAPFDQPFHDGCAGSPDLQHPHPQQWPHREWALAGVSSNPSLSPFPCSAAGCQTAAQGGGSAGSMGGQGAAVPGSPLRALSSSSPHANAASSPGSWGHAACSPPGPWDVAVEGVQFERTGAQAVCIVGGGAEAAGVREGVGCGQPTLPARNSQSPHSLPLPHRNPPSAPPFLRSSPSLPAHSPAHQQQQLHETMCLYPHPPSQQQQYVQGMWLSPSVPSQHKHPVSASPPPVPSQHHELMCLSPTPLSLQQEQEQEMCLYPPHSSLQQQQQQEVCLYPPAPSQQQHLPLSASPPPAPSQQREVFMCLSPTPMRFPASHPLSPAQHSTPSCSQDVRMGAECLLSHAHLAAQSLPAPSQPVAQPQQRQFRPLDVVVLLSDSEGEDVEGKEMQRTASDVIIVL